MDFFKGLIYYKLLYNNIIRIASIQNEIANK